MKILQFFAMANLVLHTCQFFYFSRSWLIKLTFLFAMANSPSLTWQIYLYHHGKFIFSCHGNFHFYFQWHLHTYFAMATLSIHGKFTFTYMSKFYFSWSWQIKFDFLFSYDKFTFIDMANLPISPWQIWNFISMAISTFIFHATFTLIKICLYIHVKILL